MRCRRNYIKKFSKIWFIWIEWLSCLLGIHIMPQGCCYSWMLWRLGWYYCRKGGETKAAIAFQYEGGDTVSGSMPGEGSDSEDDDELDEPEDIGMTFKAWNWHWWVSRLCDISNFHVTQEISHVKLVIFNVALKISIVTIGLFHMALKLRLWH